MRELKTFIANGGLTFLAMVGCMVGVLHSLFGQRWIEALVLFLVAMMLGVVGLLQLPGRRRGEN